jgi:hypothetical protein
VRAEGAADQCPISDEDTKRMFALRGISGPKFAYSVRTKFL